MMTASATGKPVSCKNNQCSKQAMTAESVAASFMLSRALTEASRYAGMSVGNDLAQWQLGGYGFGKQVKPDYLMGGST